MDAPKVGKSASMMADTTESWWGNVKDIQKAACWVAQLVLLMGR